MSVCLSVCLSLSLNFFSIPKIVKYAGFFLFHMNRTHTCNGKLGIGTTTQKKEYKINEKTITINFQAET